LLFRDYLRTHESTASAYETLKRRLGAMAPDTATYADAKDPGCDLIILAAEDWVLVTGWSPGPTDG
jgi:GrpB-like predicted nucleotidyltransferase (UPF0157 family)